MHRSELQNEKTEDGIKKLSLMCEESYDRRDIHDIHGHDTLEMEGKKKLVFGLGCKVGVIDIEKVKFEKVLWRADSGEKWFGHMVMSVQTLFSKTHQYIVASHIVKPSWRIENFSTYTMFYDLNDKVSKPLVVKVPLDQFCGGKFIFTGEENEKIIFGDDVLARRFRNTPFLDSKRPVVMFDNIPHRDGLNRLERPVVVENESLMNRTREFKNPRNLGTGVEGGCVTEFKKLRTRPDLVIIGGKEDVYVIDTMKENLTALSIGRYVDSPPNLFGIDTRINNKTGEETLLCGFGTIKSGGFYIGTRRHRIIETDLSGKILKRDIELFTSFSSLLYLGNDYILLGIDGERDDIELDCEYGQIFLMNLRTRSKKLVSLIHEKVVDKISFVNDDPFGRLERSSIIASSKDSVAVYTIVGKEVLKEHITFADTKDRVMFIIFGDDDSFFDFRMIFSHTFSIKTYKCLMY